MVNCLHVKLSDLVLTCEMVIWVKVASVGKAGGLLNKKGEYDDRKFLNDFFV